MTTPETTSKMASAIYDVKDALLIKGFLENKGYPQIKEILKPSPPKSAPALSTPVMPSASVPAAAGNTLMMCF